jgi:ferric-dicitrate binding protein FerR (iron transport regulator)
MFNQAFCPQSPTFLVTTNAVTLTPSAQVVSFASPASSQPAAQATGMTQMPPQARVVNTGASLVYISFTFAVRVAAVPGANPSQEYPVQPGEDRVFTLPQNPQASQTTALNMTMQINTISVGLSQALLVTFGEGT